MIRLQYFCVLIAVSQMHPCVTFLPCDAKSREIVTYYLKTLETLGDHIKNRRLALGLLQRQVAAELGTNETTLFRWERNMAQPQIRYLPRILKFLGYDPFPVTLSLADKLLAARRTLGLTQKAFAERLGVDPTTLRKWKQGRARSSRCSLKLIKMRL